MEQQVTGRVDVDSGDALRDSSMTQAEVDATGSANMLFDLSGMSRVPPDTSVSVDFGGLLFWIEVEVTRDFALQGLVLLGLSDHVGCGRIGVVLSRVEDVSPGTHWRVDVDGSTVTGPPTWEDGYEPLPPHGEWRQEGKGTALLDVTYRGDRVVASIDLRLVPDVHSTSRPRSSTVDEWVSAPTET